MYWINWIYMFIWNLGSGQPPKCRSNSGKIYPVGSVFTDRNCTVKCQCFIDGVRCEPMCEVVKQKNCLHQNIEWKTMATPDAQGNSCFCPIPVCKQSMCYCYFKIPYVYKETWNTFS